MRKPPGATLFFRDATVAEWLDALDERFKAEQTDDWRFPFKRTTREYAARQARMAVEELRYKIAAFDKAVRGSGVDV